MKCFILCIMIFLHIYDDFHFQTNSFLATGKQKTWWKENAPKEIYKYDYLVCLFLHSFTWSFTIMLPLIFYHHFQFTPMYLYIGIFNLCMHAFIDDQKANRFHLNLIQDQILHLLQILVTWYICI